MKSLSISLPAIALTLVLILSGATTAHNAAAAANTTPTPNATPAHNPAATPPNAPRQIAYYWYTYPDDAFVDHQTVAVEELEYLIYFGWLVDTNPGGTEISRGYTVNTYPHTVPPSVFLFRH